MFHCACCVFKSFYFCFLRPTGLSNIHHQPANADSGQLNAGSLTRLKINSSLPFATSECRLCFVVIFIGSFFRIDIIFFGHHPSIYPNRTPGMKVRKQRFRLIYITKSWRFFFRLELPMMYVPSFRRLVWLCCSSVSGYLP